MKNLTKFVTVALAGALVLSGCGLSPRTGDLTEEERTDIAEFAAVAGFDPNGLESSKTEVFGGNYMELMGAGRPWAGTSAYAAASQAYFTLLEEYPQMQAARSAASRDTPVTCDAAMSDSSQGATRFRLCEALVVIEGRQSGTEFLVSVRYGENGTARMSASTRLEGAYTFAPPSALPPEEVLP